MTRVRRIWCRPIFKTLTFPTRNQLGAAYGNIMVSAKWQGHTVASSHDGIFAWSWLQKWSEGGQWKVAGSVERSRFNPLASLDMLLHHERTGEYGLCLASGSHGLVMWPVDRGEEVMDALHYFSLLVDASPTIHHITTLTDWFVVPWEVAGPSWRASVGLTPRYQLGFAQSGPEMSLVRAA